MQAPGGEVDVVPAQCHQLRGPKTVAVSDQDRRGVPMPRAVLLGGLDEALDLPVGEIFTAALTLRLEPLREAASFPWKPPSRLFVLLQI
jgi:pyridoxine/pyridoxamine 5'-phosphate oxidase